MMVRAAVPKLFFALEVGTPVVLIPLLLSRASVTNLLSFQGGVGCDSGSKVPALVP